jgi:hypothetical protein
MTVRNIVRRTWLTSLLFFSTALSAPLIDQTALIVGKRICTVRDIEIASWVDEVLGQRRIVEFKRLRSDADGFKAAQSKVLQQMLIRNYLNSTGLLPAPPPERLSRLRNALESAAGDHAAFVSLLRKLKVEERELDVPLEQQAMRDAFFEEHVPFHASVSEGEVKRYFEQKKDTKFLGKPYSQVSAVVKANLIKEKKQKEFQAWLQTEMRRTEVIILPVNSDSQP